jgi:hypothetical protein
MGHGLHARLEIEDVGVGIGHEDGRAAGVTGDRDRQAGQLEWLPVRVVGRLVCRSSDRYMVRIWPVVT